MTRSSVHAGELLAGLTFPEAPRWWDDRLWFSDFHTHTVRSVGEDGVGRVELTLAGPPSGLGRLPDGGLLVVDMHGRRVLRHGPGGLVTHGDFSAHAGGDGNDMVVAADGTAYVGNFGFDPYAGEPPAPAALFRISPAGDVSTAADGLMFPNGAVIVDAGRTLVVAETYAGRLTAFAIGPDGELTERRVWAELPDGLRPDGIAADPAGGIWVACLTPEVLRLTGGGVVTHRVVCAGRALACAVGGPGDGRLFVCTTEHMNTAETLRARSGRIEVADIRV